MRVRLTPSIIRNANPGSFRLFLWDTEAPGLGYVVHPGGARSWVFQGTGSDRKRVTLQAGGLGEARKVALGLANGFLAVPTARRQAVSADVLTVGGIMERWLTSLAQRESPPVSLPRIRACVANHVMSRIGRIAFTDLCRDDLLAVRDYLASTGRRGMANQTIAYIRAALRWAEEANLIRERPRWRVSRLRLGSRAHALSDTQWRALLTILRDPSSDLRPIPRLALLALTITGCRKGEIAKLRWTDVQEGFLVIDRHKTAAISGLKRIPCPPVLMEVFQEARLAVQAIADKQPTILLRDALKASPYVFPSISRSAMGQPVSTAIDKTWIEVRARAGLPSSMTIHGLRAAFITQAQRLGLPLATVAAMVGHESPITTLKLYTAPTPWELSEGALRVAEWISGRNIASS